MSQYEAPKPGSKIIIVGGGCFGLSTALALASDKLKNYRVIVYDREQIPVRDAASNDISKVVRMDYGDNKLCMELAIDSIDIWNEWNKESKVPVYHNTGMLIFSGDSKLCENELNSLKHIRNAGHGDWVEELSARQITDRYPYLENYVKSGVSAAYYNKVGGWCNSSEAIKLVYEKCKEVGVQFVLDKEKGNFESFVCEGKSVTGIKTKDGKRHTADRVIMTTGSWTPSLIDMKRQVTATGQVVIHFRPSDKIKKLLENLPVWFGDFSRAGFYGFPINSDGVMKVALHSTGYLNPRESDQVSVPRTQSTHAQDTIPMRAVQDFRDFLSNFLPVTEELDITYSRVCWYADSVDGEFIVAPHPDYDNLIVATGDSGHAMKFLPMIGTRIAQIVEKIDNEYSRAWAWRMIEPRAGFYERPTLGDESNPITRMVTSTDLRSSKL